MTDLTQPAHVFDATAANFETDVIGRSMQTPVLVDFWAPWCGPCRTLGPLLEKLAADYNGAFLLAKVDVDKEQQLAGAFQIRSVPTVMLVKDGQLVDGFPGALPEGELRKFLDHHGIVPATDADDVETAVPEPPADPQAEVVRLRKLVEDQADTPEHKLDLALALMKVGAAVEAQGLLDGLPANLATDDRAVQARAGLGFAAALVDAPDPAVLEQAISGNPDDLRARYLLGARHMVEGRHEAALEQFMAMLRADRAFDDGLPRQALIDAFRVIEDAELVARYRRQMSALLLA